MCSVCSPSVNRLTTQIKIVSETGEALSMARHCSAFRPVFGTMMQPLQGPAQAPISSIAERIPSQRAKRPANVPPVSNRCMSSPCWTEGNVKGSPSCIAAHAQQDIDAQQDKDWNFSSSSSSSAGSAADLRSVGRICSLIGHHSQRPPGDIDDDDEVESFGKSKRQRR